MAKINKYWGLVAVGALTAAAAGAIAALVLKKDPLDDFDDFDDDFEDETGEEETAEKEEKRSIIPITLAGKVKGSSFSITRLSQHTVKMIPICLMIFIASTP